MVYLSYIVNIMVDDNLAARSQGINNHDTDPVKPRK